MIRVELMHVVTSAAQLLLYRFTTGGDMFEPDQNVAGMFVNAARETLNTTSSDLAGFTDAGCALRLEQIQENKLPKEQERITSMAICVHFKREMLHQQMARTFTPQVDKRAAPTWRSARRNLYGG